MAKEYKGIQAAELAVREEALALIIPILADHYGVDVDKVRVSSNELTFPSMYPDGETECYVNIKVSTPHGTRCIDDEGNSYNVPYDGAAAVEEYARSLAEKAIKKEKTAEKNAAKARATKKGLKQMQEEIKEIFHEEGK